VNLAAAEAVVRAVLYEGYILYPYRSSSVKNRHRWMFGTLAPRGSVEVSSMRTECLLRADGTARLDVRVRFLHPVEVRTDGAEVPSREAVEREWSLGEMTVASLCDGGQERAFSSAGDLAAEGVIPAHAVTLSGVVKVRASAAGRAGAGAYRITVEIENTTVPGGTDMTLASFLSTHTLLGVSGVDLAGGSAAEFCSLADPPEDLREASARCRNAGTWPALLSLDTVLSSPIILPDFPAIAPESLGDLFDATEIDEILTLRILTLTADEKAEIRRLGGRARALLERTEALGNAEVTRLHGALRAKAAQRFRPGDRVRLAPRGRADVFDLALAGRLATVASIEEDFEGQSYVTVTIDDDPGRDLGMTGQPGHRFFFRAEEVELFQ
jgi:hypothetical protein